MNVRVVKQRPANLFACPPFKQYVVGDDDRCAALFLKHRVDMLQKVELFVARSRPKVRPFIGNPVHLFLAACANNRETAFFSKRRVCEDHIYRVGFGLKTVRNSTELRFEICSETKQDEGQSAQTS